MQTIVRLNPFLSISLILNRSPKSWLLKAKMALLDGDLFPWYKWKLTQHKTRDSDQLHFPQHIDKLSSNGFQSTEVPLTCCTWKGHEILLHHFPCQAALTFHTDVHWYGSHTTANLTVKWILGFGSHGCFKVEENIAKICLFGKTLLLRDFCRP